MNTLKYKVLFKYEPRQLRTIRTLVALFIVALFLSGLTAMPVERELSALLKVFSPGGLIYQWLERVLLAYRQVHEKYPFLLYGYDWLAFAHFGLAILFTGPYGDPVKNIWVIEFGLIACALIPPFAFIAGYYRGIPTGWTLIDCSFGVFGCVPLLICYCKIKNLIARACS